MQGIMKTDPITYSVSTTEGKISIWDSQGTGSPVLFLHSNSACKEAFLPQFKSKALQKYRLIAMDFSGHGASDKAKHREKIYSVEGHAKVVQQVLKKLKLESPVVVGWSLGGHVALELIRKKV